MSEYETFTVDCAIESVHNITKTLNRVERMFARRGMEFTYEFSEPRHVIKSVKPTFVDSLRRNTKQEIKIVGWDAREQMTSFKTVKQMLTVTMTTLSNEWEMLYTITPANPDEPHGSHAVIRQNPMVDLEEATLPEVFEDHCDHCTSGRRGRHKVMRMRNKKTGVQVSIGSTCVLEYTGIDPSLLENLLKIKANAYTGSDGEKTPTKHDSQPSADFAIKCALYALGGTGYKKGLGTALFGAYLHDFDEKGICLAVWGDNKHMILAPAGGVHEVGDLYHFANEDAKNAVLMSEVFAFASDFHQWCESLSGASSFEHSVRSIYKSGVVTRKNASMAAGALSGFLRSLKDNKVKKTTEKAKNDGVHMGEVGQRRDFKGSEVVFVRQIDGYYGISTLTKFNCEGNTLVWFRSGSKTDLVVGGVVDLTATVKKHDNYGDEKQTVITRGKFSEPQVYKGATRSQ